MKTRSLSVLALAGLAATLGMGPATAQLPNNGTPLYSYFYYSDATYTQLVGGGSDNCNGYFGSGTVTQYKVVEQIGVCRNGMAIYW